MYERTIFFFTIDTTLPVRDPLRFRIFFLFTKMTVTDQPNSNQTKANQAQYDLDRLAAQISEDFSGDLKKYEYLTVEDLG